MSNIEELIRLKDKIQTEQGGYDMCRGMQEWLEERYEEGISVGVGQGEDKFSQLVQKLAMENGLDKILHAAEDKNYRTELYNTFLLASSFVYFI